MGHYTCFLYQCHYGATTPKCTNKSLQPPQGFINIDIPRFPSDGKYEGPLPQQWPCPSHGIKRSLAWMLRVNGAQGPLPHRWRGGFFGNRVHPQHQVQSSSVEHPEQQLDRPQGTRPTHSEIQSFCSGHPWLQSGLENEVLTPPGQKL